MYPHPQVIQGAGVLVLHIDLERVNARLARVVVVPSVVSVRASIRPGHPHDHKPVLAAILDLIRKSSIGDYQVRLRAVQLMKPLHPELRVNRAYEVGPEPLEERAQQGFAGVRPHVLRRQALPREPEGVNGKVQDVATRVLEHVRKRRPLDLGERLLDGAAQRVFAPASATTEHHPQPRRVPLTESRCSGIVRLPHYRMGKRAHAHHRHIRRRIAHVRRRHQVARNPGFSQCHRRREPVLEEVRHALALGDCRLLCAARQDQLDVAPEVLAEVPPQPPQPEVVERLVDTRDEHHRDSRGRDAVHCLFGPVLDRQRHPRAWIGHEPLEVQTCSFAKFGRHLPRRPRRRVEPVLLAEQRVETSKYAVHVHPHLNLAPHGFAPLCRCSLVLVVPPHVHLPYLLPRC